MSLGNILAGASNTFWGAVGGYYQDKRQRQANEQNRDIQYDFAQNGLRWRVEDAKRAGIHPLAALGFQGPQAQGTYMPGTGLSETFKEHGQNVSRAVASTQTEQERQLSQLQIQSAQADVDGKVIDNAIRAKTLRDMNMSPPMAGSEYLVPGQTQSGLVKGVPLERVRSPMDAPHSEGAPIADVGWAEVSPGTYVAIPSKDMKERIEDNFFHEATHFVRNNLSGKTPPRSWLKPGEEWFYNWSEGGWSKRRIPSHRK